MAALTHGDSRQTIAWGVWVVVIVLCVLPVFALVASALGGAGHASADMAIASILMQSVVLSLSATLTALAIGSGLAFVLLRTDIPGRRGLLGLFALPLFIPSYIHALTWSRLLGEAGALSWLTEALVATGAAKGFFGVAAAFWVYVASYYPIALLIVAAAVLHWDQRFQEAGLLHARPGVVWRAIHWRFLRGYLAVAGFLTFFLIFSDFGVPDYFQVQVYAAEVFVQLSAYLDTSAAMLLSLPPFVLGMLMLLFVMKLLRRVQFGARDGGFRTPTVMRLGRLRGFVLLALVCCVLFLVVLPLGQLVTSVGSLDIFLRAVKAGWWDGLVGVGFALVATLIALGVGLLAGYVGSRRVSPAAVGLRWIPLAMLVLPAALIALGYIGLWNQPGLAGTAYMSGVALVLALAARALPLAVETCATVWSRVPESQEQAAFASGVAFVPAFRTILLPRLRGALLVGGLITFIFIFNELGMVVLLAPPGVSTLPMRIFSTVHYGPDDLVAAMCLFQILILALPTGMLFMTTHRHFSVTRG